MKNKPETATQRKRMCECGRRRTEEETGGEGAGGRGLREGRPVGSAHPLKAGAAWHSGRQAGGRPTGRAPHREE